MIPLFRLFSLAYLRHRPLKVFLTLLGMAAGIAVYVAIDLSNRSVLNALERTIDQTRGGSDLSVAARSGLLGDADYARVLGLPGTEAATPILEFSGYCPANEDRTLAFLGIDPLTRAAFFPSEKGGPASASSFLALMEGRNLALVPPQAAGDCGIADGGTFGAVVAGRSVVLTARVPPARGTWWDGSSLVFLDIAAAQEIFAGSGEDVGRLSRVEVLLGGTDRASWKREATAALGEDAVFLGKGDELGKGARILRAFQINLLALGLVSIFVAVFIVYNSASLAFLQRRGDMARLRALGLSRRRLTALFACETFFFGVVSVLLGIGLGRLLAGAIFSKILRTVGALYRMQGGAEIALTLPTVAVALGIGLGAALLGALVPLWEASSIAPVEAARKLSFERRFQRRPGFFLALSAFFFAAWGGLAAASGTARPETSFAAALASLLGFLLLTPLFLSVWVRLLASVARRFRLTTVLVSCGQFLENPYRYGVVTAALVLGVALWLGVGTMVHSFRASVEDWIQAAIRGDVYLNLKDNPESGYEAFLTENFIEGVYALPGVAHFDTLRVTPVRAGGEETLLSSIALRRLMGARVFKVLEGDRGAFNPVPEEEKAEDVLTVAVAESLARRLRLRAGGRFEAETRWGRWPLRVGAVLYDYSSERGLIYVDSEDFAKKTGDRRISGIALFLKDPSQAPAVARALRKRPDLPPSLAVSRGAEVRGRVLRIFDETFQVTEALKYVAVFVAFLGIVSTLSILFEQKRWEIGLLAAMGLSPAGLRRYGLAQGLLLASAGSLLGIGAGLALCWNIIHLIHKSFFGWTIFFDFDAATVFWSCSLTLLTGAAASLALIRRLARLKPAEALRYDE